MQGANISVFEKKKYQPLHADDRVNEKEVVTYSEYRQRQIQKLAVLQKENLEDEITDAEHAQMEMIKETVLDKMSQYKKEIWLDIYNDYVAHIKKPFDDKYEEEMVLGIVNPHENENSLFNSVRTQEDFYELFRNWEFKKRDHTDFRYPLSNQIPDQIKLLEDIEKDKAFLGDVRVIDDNLVDEYGDPIYRELIAP